MSWTRTIPRQKTNKRKFVLNFKRAPGDVLMLTAMVRDIKLTYGDRYQVDVRTQFPGIWRHNPHLTKLSRHAKDVKFIDLKDGDRQALRMTQRGQKIHYVTAFHREFERLTGIEVPVLYSKGDLHLGEEEKKNPRISGRYWIIVPGGKTDMSTKWWPTERYNEVVQKLRPWGLQFVQEGATKDLCYHPPIDNVLNLVGMTSVRDLIVNIYHAEGVICGITFQMHIAGALDKPCVSIMGGREEPWYEWYSDHYKAFGTKAEPVKVPHRMLHTLGQLSCCQTKGCWRRRTVPLHDGKKDYDKNLCLKPIREDGTEPRPECMQMIQTNHVLEAVMHYYEQGILPSLPQWGAT